MDLDKMYTVKKRYGIVVSSTFSYFFIVVAEIELK